MGFAAGVMLAASFWSLLAPAIELATESGTYGQVCPRVIISELTRSMPSPRWRPALSWAPRSSPLQSIAFLNRFYLHLMACALNPQLLTADGCGVAAAPLTAQEAGQAGGGAELAAHSHACAGCYGAQHPRCALLPRAMRTLTRRGAGGGGGLRGGGRRALGDVCERAVTTRNCSSAHVYAVLSVPWPVKPIPMALCCRF
jgi:hypothetical protein